MTLSRVKVIHNHGIYTYIFFIQQKENLWVDFMNIDCILRERLYAFRYNKEEDHELDRLIELWKEVSYLYGFARLNNVADINAFVDEILKDAEELEDYLHELEVENTPYSHYFEPLQYTEFGKALPRQKGKRQKSRLRLYAIKIDKNCFVITGGAIKMSQKMQDHPATAEELRKLNRAKDYLENNGVFDSDSFFELLNAES